MQWIYNVSSFKIIRWISAPVNKLLKINLIHIQRIAQFGKELDFSKIEVLNTEINNDAEIELISFSNSDFQAIH